MTLTRPYKRGTSLFMYDKDNCIVWYVAKMTAENKAENVEWNKRWGKNLYDTDPTGEYMLIDGVGLRKENWRNREARDEYLDLWLCEMEEEMAYLLRTEFGL